MLMVKVGYPSDEGSSWIAQTSGPRIEVQKVTPEQMAARGRSSGDLRRPPRSRSTPSMRVRDARARRRSAREMAPMIGYGASPRATIGAEQGAMGAALMQHRGLRPVIPED